MASKLSESLAPDDDSSTLLAHNDNDSHTPGPRVFLVILLLCGHSYLSMYIHLIYGLYFTKIYRVTQNNRMFKYWSI